MSDSRTNETNLFGTIIICTKAALPYFSPKESRSFGSFRRWAKESGLQAWALFGLRNGVFGVSQNVVPPEWRPLGHKVLHR